MSESTAITTVEPVVREDPVVSAKAAGLRYVSDAMPGIRREREGEDFRYIAPDGTPITDEDELKRIRSLAIPPAWTDVWICPNPRGHIQATARDAKGRKQYRYHPRWREVRDENKFSRMLAFGQALPAIRARVESDMELRGLPRAKVLATVVKLLETTLIRVGNVEYARENKSYGLTTMRDKHVDIEGATVRFEFKGKSGKKHSVDIRDPQLAKIVRKCRDIPGYELFQYIDDDGTRQTIDSADVNEYLREITGQDFTAKDFRTWAGTVLATLMLQEIESADSPTQAKKNIVGAVEKVAERLGNTPAICRKCYIHPAVLDTYLEGTMLESLQQITQEELNDPEAKLKPEEAALMRLLQTRLAQEEQHDAEKPKRGRSRNRATARAAAAA